MNEDDCDSPTYAAINLIKEELDGANELIKGRFDLIHKVDSSKVGWVAVPHYEKTNGYLVNSDSAKNWEAAEKKVIESRNNEKKEDKKTPFRSWPAGSGRYQYQNYSKSSSRGELSHCLFIGTQLVLCFLLPCVCFVGLGDRP